MIQKYNKYAMKTRKFNRNPINQLKLEINKIITANNAKKRQSKNAQNN